MKKGFMLIELALSIGLIAILSLFVVGVFYTNTTLFQKQQTDINLSTSARLAIDDINKNIKDAITYKTNYTNGPDNYNCINPPPATCNALILQLPALDNSNPPKPIENNVDFDYVVFYKKDEKLIKKVYPDSSSSRKAATQILTASLNQTNDNVKFTIDLPTNKRCADVNFDGIVNNEDVFIVRDHFGHTFPATWDALDPFLDLGPPNTGPNGFIDSADIALAVQQIGTTCPRVFVKTELTLEEQTSTKKVEVSQSGEALFRNRTQ